METEDKGMEKEYMDISDYCGENSSFPLRMLVWDFHYRA